MFVPHFFFANVQLKCTNITHNSTQQSNLKLNLISDNFVMDITLMMIVVDRNIYIPRANVFLDEEKWEIWRWFHAIFERHSRSLLTTVTATREIDNVSACDVESWLLLFSTTSELCWCWRWWLQQKAKGKIEFQERFLVVVAQEELNLAHISSHVIRNHKFVCRDQFQIAAASCFIYFSR